MSRYRVHLRDSTNGYTAMVELEWPVSTPGPEFNVVTDAESDIIFLWTEGNFACDCNRVNMLYGRDHGLDDEFNCDTQRIIVDRIEWADGRIIADGEED
jgi:hypothetical protein